MLTPPGQTEQADKMLDSLDFWPVGLR